jgi:formylglycine-generating enzyme required for sulfatase activity
MTYAMIWFSPISLVACCALVGAAETVAGETAVAHDGMVSISGGSFAMGAVTNVTLLYQRTFFRHIQ